MAFWDLFKSKKKREEAAKYKKGMAKTRKATLSRLGALFAERKTIDGELFNELEEIFIMADIGVETVLKFVDELKADPRLQTMHESRELQPLIVDKMFDIYLKGEFLNANLNGGAPAVYLFVGVNGSGKTTSIAKIAHRLQQAGKKVLLVAGDTFRAAATSQLEIWADRLHCQIVTGAENQDPASVVFEGLKAGKALGVDAILIDTAGRLQTKVNLMNELAKIKRVISREIPAAPHDTLLVIDATTGQNGLNQAKAFLEATAVTGVVLTKLDGTAKGGIVLAIRDVYNIPIKFVGLGEALDDLEPFEIEKYVYGLFAEDEE